MGAEVFADAHCDLCHSNATFTGAANPQTFNINADKTGSTFVDRIGLIPSNTNNIVDYTLVDLGFFNTGVVLDENDIGLGGQDPWRNPFSYSQQH